MIRGWCPTVHAPMPSGDGLLARVKPFGGRLPAAALAAVADGAARYGTGLGELTSRGNLQVRGVRDAAGFAHAMVAAGLADADPVREARRNVTAVPPCDDAVVAEVEAVLTDVAGLPPKFSVVVRRAEVFVAGEVVAVGALRGVLMRLAGSLSQGGIASPPPLVGGGRGEGCRTQVTGQGGSAELARSDSVATPPLTPPTRGGGYPAALTSCVNGVALVGVEASHTHLLYLPFHQTTAPTLAHLATLAPEIRTTPWRAFLSPVPAPGFASEPGTITACPGAPACSSATVPARVDAATLQAAGFANLHISGCAKGCAHPGVATTLVGRDGRYDLVRHGRASDPADRHGLTLREAMAAL